MRPHINNISAALLTVCQWGLPMGQEEGFFWGGVRGGPHHALEDCSIWCYLSSIDGMPVCLSTVESGLD